MREFFYFYLFPTAKCPITACLCSFVEKPNTIRKNVITAAAADNTVWTGISGFTFNTRKIVMLTIRLTRYFTKEKYMPSLDKSCF